MINNPTINPAILVHEPHVFICFISSRATGEIIQRKVDPRYHIFAAIILITIGSSLMGLQIGGRFGILGVGSTLALSLVVIALAYVKGNQNLQKKNESLFHADEILESMIDKPTNIMPLVEKFQLGGIVKFIHYISQKLENAHVKNILPELFRRIKHTNNPKIDGEIYCSLDQQKTKWDTVKEATLREHGDLEPFLDKIFKEALPLEQDDVKGQS